MRQRRESPGGERSARDSGSASGWRLGASQFRAARLVLIETRLSPWPARPPGCCWRVGPHRAQGRAAVDSLCPCVLRRRSTADPSRSPLPQRSRRDAARQARPCGFSAGCSRSISCATDPAAAAARTSGIDGCAGGAGVARARERRRFSSGGFRRRAGSIPASRRTACCSPRTISPAA